MKVIGAGFGRTGTLSLKAALERLGFGPCYHMVDVMEEPYRVRHWLGVARGDGPGWDEVFAGYRSTVDWPAATYWRALAERYPDAKVLLTVRDPDRWYDSARETIFERELASWRPSRTERAIEWLVERRSPDFALFTQMAREVIAEPLFDGRLDRAHAIEVFERHNAEVRAAIPAERLLVFDVREGWAPLCAFLDVPVPDEPFPRVNDRAEFRRRRPRRLLRLAMRGA